MRVHFFTKGPSVVASSRQRAFLVAEALRRRGVDAVVHAPSAQEVSHARWPKKLLLIVATVRNLSTVRKGDVLWLQRTVYNKYMLGILVAYRLIFRPAMIFDIDDAVYLNSPFKTSILARLSDAVAVGSHALADWAKKYNSFVVLIPTCTDFHGRKIEPFFTRGGSKPLTLGWVGNGPAHRENLAFLRDVFLGVSEKGIPLRFILVGAMKDEGVCGLFRGIPNLSVEYVEWTGPESVPAVITRFDLGLMPLTDTPFHRGKCAMKVIEYMACGVPALASPVGENCFVIRRGENGFLAETKDAWVDTLTHMSEHPESLAAMGESARTTAETWYTFDAVMPKIIALIQEVAHSSI